MRGILVIISLHPSRDSKKEGTLLGEDGYSTPLGNIRVQHHGRVLMIIHLASPGPEPAVPHPPHRRIRCASLSSPSFPMDGWNMLH